MKKIGEGSYGAVYLHPDGKHVVKKYKQSGEIPYQTLREINILKSVNHHNIVRCEDVYLQENVLCMKMCHGGKSLSSYIRSTPTRERVQKFHELFSQIVAACAYLHARGIAHRDLKPDNILVDGDLHVRVCDFGLAKFSHASHNRHSYQTCTLCYRPPEVFIFDNESGHISSIFAIDVWALACVGYEIITGKQLFPGKSEIRVLEQILKTIPVTQEKLMLLGLDSIRLEKCNTWTYHRLPDLSEHYKSPLDPMKHELDKFKNIAVNMLTLLPNDRCSVFDVATALGIHNETTREPNINTELQPNTSLANLVEKYHLSHETYELACRMLCRYGSAELDAKTKLCCLVLASKYSDTTPICLKKFRNRYDFHELTELEMKIYADLDFYFY
jgi:serine/threonine protein kinase